MEIIDRGDDPSEGPVQVAYADTREEAALIRGLLREEGIKSIARQPGVEGGAGSSSLLTRSPRRIYVRPADAARARELIGEVMVEDPLEEDIPESANAEYLADATGRKPRNYSVVGAYARAWIAAAIVLGIVFVVLLILR
jgi:hypothetical protein